MRIRIGLLVLGLVFLTGCNRDGSGKIEAPKNTVGAGDSPKAQAPVGGAPGATSPANLPDGGPGKADQPPQIDLAELDRLPVGIDVKHDPVKPKPRAGTKQEQWPLVWPYQTTVKNLTEKPLRLVQFGQAQWQDGKWVISSDPRELDASTFTIEQFNEWYLCPNGMLEVGKSYSDPNNWSGNRKMTSFKHRWFFIATDPDGKRYKGESVIELETGTVPGKP